MNKADTAAKAFSFPFSLLFSRLWWYCILLRACPVESLGEKGKAIKKKKKLPTTQPGGFVSLQETEHSASLSLSLQELLKMPRPGPRPYDCVRRAWHSDTHQPIRGTLIQEIFRVVNEIHGPATKKNKEYQEKLPVVVLKAEEIMYSKANSEAEYMDLTTLLDRANDAIDTIIRRDESTETGEYLQPCIEAALCLGCAPVKASRSQRNSPRCYLSPPAQEPVQKLARGDHTAKSHFVPPCSNFVKSTRLGSEYQRLVFRNDDLTPSSNTVPLVSEHFPSTSKKQCLEHQPLSNLFSVYPLYIGNHIPLDESHNVSTASYKSVSNTSGPDIMGGVGNHLASNFTASRQKSQSLTRGDPDQNKPTIGCDLSLRLGPLSMAAPNVERRSKRSGDIYQEDKKFSSFSWDRPTVQKRKADFVCLKP